MGTKKSRNKKATETLNQPAKDVRHGRIVWLGLVVIVVLVGLMRYRLLDVPLERDEGEYAYAGQLILQGVAPYTEVYNMKLPGIYGVYALILAVFGQSCRGIHAALLLVNAVTILFVFLLGRRILRSSLSAMVAAGSFAIFSVSPSVQGVFANAEHFVILFSLAGILVLERCLRKGRWLSLFWAGILLGLGFVVKQHGLAFVFFAGLYVVYDWFRRERGAWRSLAVKLGALAGGVLTVIGCLLLLMAWLGVFKSFWFWTVDYARMYLVQTSLDEAWFLFQLSTKAILYASPFLWVLGAFGFVCTLVTRKAVKEHRAFLLILGVFSFLSVCPGFYFREHYFVLLLPCVSLFLGVGIDVLNDFLSRQKLPRVLLALLIVICFGHSVYNQREFLFVATPTQASRMVYGENPFPEAVEIAKFIRQKTLPEDRIAVFGSEPEIFFYSQRRSVSGHVYMYPLMEQHDFAIQMQREFIEAVETKDPKYLIFVNIQNSWLRDDRSHTDIFDWIHHYYDTGRLKAVGVIELFENQTIYSWGPYAGWPPQSPYSVAIFEWVPHKS